MGFGLLFFGYALTFLLSINPYGYIFALTGTAVMLSSLSKLCLFERRFALARLICFVLTVLSMAMCVIAILPFDTVDENVFSYVLAAFLILAFPYHFLVYNSIYRISDSVGDIKIKRRALRNSILLVFEVLIASAAVIFWYFKIEFAKYLLMTAVIFPILLIFLNLSLFYSCYKNICEEGDEDAPRKPSKIPFLNKLFEASEKREQEIYEKTKSYAENKIRQDNEKKKMKNKKKKK